MQILVVGFPRSGTSLTYRIIENHPDVKKMFFEKWLLKQADSKKDLVKKFPVFENTCGEKVIWEKRVIGKIGKTNQTIIDYCLKWNKWFKDEARIVQIIRHPFDSLNSLVLSKKRFPRGASFNFIYPEYLNYASLFVDGIRSIPNCMTIKYESLISKPDQTIRKIYKHCNLKTDYKYKEHMKSKRIFNYLNMKNFNFEYNDRLSSIIDTFNKIDGVTYLNL